MDNEPKNLKNLKKRNLERSSAKEFWEQKREEYEKLGAKEVFEKYRVFCSINDLPALNEYIFRTYLRKNGWRP